MDPANLIQNDPYQLAPQDPTNPEESAGPIQSSESPNGKRRWFLTTQWAVLTAAQEQASPTRQEALENICRTYWVPLYSYVRCEGYSPEDARDLTQGFFARFLQKNSVASLDPRKGRFRSFLVASLRHYLADGRDRLRALKRGGGLLHLSLDLLHAEEFYHLEPLCEMDPSTALDRSWALQLLEQARAQLSSEYGAEGSTERFELIEQFLPGSHSTQSYAEVAGLLNLAVGTIKWEVHRLRARYRQVLRAEVAKTVATADQVDEEVRHLIDAVSL